MDLKDRGGVSQSAGSVSRANGVYLTSAGYVFCK